MLDLAKKELTERAARRSTYWARVLNLGLLVGILLVAEGSRPDRSTVALSGNGFRLFYSLAWAQWAAILLFVPLSMAGAIAAERERGSWDLLQLTDLKPWEIIAQKFTAGMVPCITSILLLAPVGAMTLSAGGLETSDIWHTILSLTVVAVLIGAISMLCSTLAVNATTATLAAYVIAAALLLVPSLSPAAALLQLQSGERALYFPLMVQLGASFVMLVLANYWLMRPPFERAGRIVTSLRWIRGRLDRRDGVSRVDDSLLTQSPVAWRELKRHSLDRWQGLLFYALPVMLIVGGVTCGVVYLPNWQPRVVMPILNGCLWIGSFLLLALVSANMVMRERSQQTLAILLTTPIQSGALMKQKARALRHLALICALVISSSAAASVFVRTDLTPWIYVIMVALELLFYLPMVYWLGLIIGARSTNWRRAVMLVFVVLGAIIGMPFLGLFLPALIPFAILSPTGYIMSNELGTADPLWTSIMAMFHFGLMALVTLGLRHLAVWFASSWLQRTQGSAWVNPEEPHKQVPTEDPY